MKKLITTKSCLLFLNGYGNGNGDGYGNGNGDGYGNGYGDGYGNGDGNGDGYGDGDGDGDGYGDGNGNGNGYGNGDFRMPHPYYKIDGIWCEILQIKGDYARVNIVDVYNAKNCKPAFIAKSGSMFAHGDTLHEARESLMYKVGDRDTSQYKEWALNDIKTPKELIPAYRAITGACEMGTRNFCNSIKLPKKCKISDAINLTKGQYGWEKFNSFFNKIPA